MKIAIVGATGLVGQEMIKVMEESKLPVEHFYPVATEKSKGKTILFQDKQYEVITIKEALEAKIDVAVFSAGSKISKEYAPLFAKNNTTVVDNSSAWRSFNHIPLIVPEVNAKILSKKDKIIANPNCSTIQLVMALAPLHFQFEAERLVISTYQSVTGSGIKGVQQLESEQKGLTGAENAYPHPIHNNLLPQGGAFLDNGYTEEEMKLVNETKKILQAPSLRITSTVVRVPVTGGHSISLNAAFKKNFLLSKINQILEESPGIIVQDMPDQNKYPMPLYSRGKDEVFVGRIRMDESNERTINMWIVADNLRKGAATNAIQIVEHLNYSGLL